MGRINMKTLSLIAIFLIQFGHVYASQTVAPNKSYNLKMGKGINIYNPTNNKFTCLKFKDSNDKGKLYAQKTTYSSHLITKQKQISRVLNEEKKYSDDVKASIFDLVSIKSKLNLHQTIEKYFKSNTESIVYLIKAESDYGQQIIDVDDLKPQYKSLISSGKHEEFITKCGTHFVNSKQLYGRIYAAIVLENLTSSTKNKIRTKLKHEGGADFFEVVNVQSKIESDITKILEIAQKFGSVSVKFWSHGGDGLLSVEEILSNSASNDIHKILRGISKYVKSFRDKASAYVSSYGLDSYEEKFGLKVNNYPKSIVNRMKVLRNKLDRVQNVIERIQAVETNNAIVFTNYLSGRLLEYQEIERVITKELQSCVNDRLCDMKSDNHDINRVWLNDLIKKPKISIKCNQYVDIIKNGRKNGEVLESYTISAKGTMPFFKVTNTSSLKAFALDEDFNALEIDSEQFQLSLRPGQSSQNEKPFKATIDYRHMPIEYNNRGEIDLNNLDKPSLRAAYDQIQNAEYYISVSNIEDNRSRQSFFLGPLNMSKCPLYKEK